MPDREVETVRDLIYYQYAKIIARRAFSATDGKKAKRQHYGFIKKTFKELRSGIKSRSDIMREDWQLVESEKGCIYCGAEADLSKEHIVPRSLEIKPECVTCDIIQGIHNQVWACKPCNSSKGKMGLYEFFKSRYPYEKKFYDFIPPLLEKKYLKTIYDCHVCANTMDKGDIDGDGEISVLDIDFVLH
ncbi:MAG: HNH endonuclease [candidate division Zixibacteria bacterium]|nr:HNH endonuclease [candidate division Zixibacteria bacterium]